jgi:hypothetical protein
MDRNRDRDMRARYQKHLCKDLVPRGQEETKVYKKVYERLRKESKGKKGNASEREPTVP